MPAIEELEEIVVRVAALPQLRLVHVDIGDRGALVLTPVEARAVARDLDRAAGRAARVPARPRARKRVAAA